jgi:hypothetical protein
MLVFVTGTHVGMRNGKFYLSVNKVISRLDNVKIPRVLAEQLYKISKHSQVDAWKKEAAFMLCCLSGDNGTLMNEFRNNRDNIIEVISMRFDATVNRKVNNKANNFKKLSLSKIFEEGAKEMVYSYFPFEVD